jgi:transglutaminase-like putative cysteine protease
MNRHLLQRVRLPILAALAGIAWQVHAENTNLYTGDNWRLLDLKPVLSAASDVTLKKYPDCDEATVDSRSVRVYHADGTAEAQDETFTKVLTEKGRRSNRTLTTGFLLPYFRVEVPKLEIIKPDGTVVPVDVAANSKESIDENQMSMNIYDPNDRVLRVNIPKLEVGDIVHSVTRQTTSRAIIAGAYTEVMLFESPGYILHTTYEVQAPKDRPLKCIRMRDEIKGTVTYTKRAGNDGTTVHTWEVNKVPRMFEEPGMPSAERVLQRLLVSTMPDWQTVSKWYWNLSKAHLDTVTPEMKKQVAELTAGCTNDLQKVTALFYYVSKNIRYMGRTPETDRPGFEPHDVCLTFDKKYGVCRDKAGLLVAMLRTAGLNAYPVLINVGTKRDPEVPDSYFNHAIACVELAKGKYTLMDPTDENTQDLLPDHDRDQSYLVCRPEGERLQISPIRPVEENMMRVKTTGTLDAAGRIVAKSELWFDGVNDNEYRNAFVKMKPDDLERFFQLALKHALPGAKLTSLKIMPEDMLDTSSSLHADMEFTVDGMIAAGNGKAVVSLPWIGKNVGIAGFIIQSIGGLEQRKYPLKTEMTCGLDEQISLKLADGFTKSVSMPDCKPVDNECLGYKEQVTFANQSLNADRQLKLKVVEFSPAQYLQLRKVLEHLEYDERKSPVLAMSGAATTSSAVAAKPAAPVNSNARILDAHKEITVTDAHTSVLRSKYSKQILTYNGKKRESEVKIEYNPSCQEAKVISAVVISKDGQRQEISPDEMSAMDAGWNSSAKRYTGGKILVANLPGVEIGSTIEVEYEVKTTGKPFLAGYEMFQMPDGMDKKQVHLTVPTALDVQSYAGGASGIVKTDSSVANGNRTFQWSAENVKALPAERQLPPEWVYAAGVGYFIGDAAAYWKELNDTMLDRAHKNTKAAELARQLTASAKNKVEAVKAIRDYIAKSIRTAGPSFTDLPLAELSDADTTLADGYGHLADRAILFHAMLAAAGFHPEFVMASKLPPIAGITNVIASLPLPQNFDAPLVRVTLDGEIYYLNDTDQYAQLGSTAHDGRMAVVPATQAFETVKAAKDCCNKADAFYSMTLSDNGKARITIRRQYFGMEYSAKNKFFAELPPEEKNRYFQELVSSIAQGAKPVDKLATKFDTYPGVEEFTVEIDHYCVVDGKNYYFDLPFALSMIGGGADQRALPFYLPVTMDNTIRAEIKLPPGFQHPVIVPTGERLEMPAGAGSAVVTSTNAHGQFTVNYQMELAPAIISPADYPSVLDVESTLGKKSARVFLLEKGK